jgi:transcriptional regulator with XRE-family HTH domain
MENYKRLRDLREDADLTQKAVGTLLNTTQQQYAKYELGVQEIPTRHLVTLAEYYNVSVDYIVGRGDWTEVQMYRFWKNRTEKEKQQIFHKLHAEYEK